MFVYVQPEQMNRGLVTQTLKRIRGSEGLNRSATVNLGATRQTNMNHEREQRMMSVAHAKTACAFIGHARHKTVVPRSREEHVYPTKRSLIGPDKSRQQAGETVSNQVRQSTPASLSIPLGELLLGIDSLFFNRNRSV